MRCNRPRHRRFPRPNEAAPSREPRTTTRTRLAGNYYIRSHYDPISHDRRYPTTSPVVAHARDQRGQTHESPLSPVRGRGLGRGGKIHAALRRPLIPTFSPEGSRSVWDSIDPGWQYSTMNWQNGAVLRPIFNSAPKSSPFSAPIPTETLSRIDRHK